MDDLISRQAAIDMLKNRWKKTRNYEGIGDDIAEECELYLKQLPSAHPEQQIPQMRGWVCPVCGRGLSPYTSVCPCNNGKGWEITC